VCRGWRSVLLERSLWTRLEVSRASGVRVHEGADRGVLDSLLRCAAARSGGGLHSLQVDTEHVTHAALMDVVAANAGALRELHACSDKPYRGVVANQVEALCDAAPLLRTFTTDVYGTSDMGVQAVRRALRNEAPFGALRVGRLGVYLDDEDEAGVIAFAADVAAHTWLTGLKLREALLNTPAALDAVVDAARRLQLVTLYDCHLSPASVPALARLLSHDALTELELCWVDVQLLDVPAAAVLAAALRANATLTSLALNNACVFDDPAAGAELLGALTGHASLQVLSVLDNHVQAAGQAAAGAALGALVAANAPSLTHLNVSYCDLGDDGLRPLLEALPRNTYLRKLDCAFNFMSEAFMADVLLPAVRANDR
jgi:hypothetical protein